MSSLRVEFSDFAEHVDSEQRPSPSPRPHALTNPLPLKTLKKQQFSSGSSHDPLLSGTLKEIADDKDGSQSDEDVVEPARVSVIVED
jgi:hypothetical protein